MIEKKYKSQPTMKAAVFHQAYEPLSIEDVPLKPLKSTEIRVRIETCSVCHVDLQYVDQGLATAKAPPLILGHEISGVVEETGKNVTLFRSGNRVIVPGTMSCGKCLACKSWNETQCDHLKILGNHVDGGYAEYITIDQNQLVSLPDEFPFELGSLISNVFVGAYHLVYDRVNIHQGETVVIFGSGGFGLSLLQMAKLKQAHVYMVDIFDWKLNIARDYNADGILNSNKCKVCEEGICDMIGGKADVVIETTGTPRTMVQAMNVLHKGGRLVLSGYSENTLPFLAARIIMNEMSLIGSIGTPLRKIPDVIKLVNDGKIRWQEMITYHFPLSQINEAFNTLRMGQSIRTVIHPNQKDI
ncbi:MAG: zinc-binding dehydrogenase [Candidatus Marinimicrobia bacterium]|nr:zinc-binding dehydrogenase [Candidatus Neomarinimicrobiota bacterium]MDD5582814.1 zinc-binding dehydrogenase [Candidatus Neomarinimicrobiota bacterium]